jgi:hypothetical protein
MSYTKAHMREIFRRGAMFGFIAGHTGGDTIDRVDEVEREFFDQCLKSIRDDIAAGKPNPNRFDSAKALEWWDNRGRPSGEGVLPGIGEWLLDKSKK